MDKSLILNEIKKYLGFKKDSDFANFLGIKQNTLSTWKSRNTIDYDLIISKCDKIDANWLITGKGTMLKNDNDNIDNEVIKLQEDIKERDKEIDRLKIQIDKLFNLISTK